MAAGDLAAQRLTLFDREQRRVLDRCVLDAEVVQGGEKLVGGRLHRATISGEAELVSRST